MYTCVFPIFMLPFLLRSSFCVEPVDNTNIIVDLFEYSREIFVHMCAVVVLSVSREASAFSIQILCGIEALVFMMLT